LFRAPTEKEAAPLVGLLHSARASFAGQPEEAKKLGGSPDVAAWTTVVRVLLNTDEFITRD
jgi:hypothetical protein